MAIAMNATRTKRNSSDNNNHVIPEPSVLAVPTGSARGMPLQEPSRPVVILPVLANGIPQQTRVLSEPKGPIQTVHMATKNKQAQPVPEKQEQKVLHQCPKITVFTSPCPKLCPKQVTRQISPKKGSVIKQHQKSKKTASKIR